MELKTRMDAVRVSIRLPRAAFATSVVASLLLVAVFAGALLASPEGRPLLMNFDRIAPSDPADDEPDLEREASDLLDERRSADVEIIEVRDIRWIDDEVRYFNGRPIRPVKTLTMVVTAYSPDERSCGKWADGITASGYSVWTNGMKLVAADTSILPFGSLVSIPGYDNENVVPVLDRGGAIKGMRLDVLYPTHERARRWGVQELEVTVWDYADGAPNGFRTNHRRR